MELDIENFDSLRQYLAEHGHLGHDETIVCKKLEGGISNRAVRIQWKNGPGWVLKQSLAKLRVREEWFSSPERIQVEAKALQEFNRIAPCGMTPSFIFQDPANHLVAMEAIPEEYMNWKECLLSGEVDPLRFEQFGVLLGIVHRASFESAARLRVEFSDTTYFENLRLQPYYRFTAHKVAAASTFLNQLAAETLRYKQTLVHGDFSPKNTLIYQKNLVLLDFEVVHFGDPAFDLGFALTHFLSKAHHLPHSRDRLMSATGRFWAAYTTELVGQQWAGSEFESRVARHTLGCLLARVEGKSPLEYLTKEEVVRQRDVVLALIATAPATVSHLINEFINKVEKYARD